MIREELSEATAATLASLPERQSLRRMINRKRCSVRPANPRSLDDLQIVDPYDKTLTGEAFLLLDNKHDMEEPQPNRIVIFATEQNIRLLFSSADWYSDGTFSIVPSLFYQLWTIHGRVLDQVFPLVYALTTNKTEEVYVTILRTLKQKAVQLRHPHAELFPVTSMTDFETAAINAFQNIFPTIRIHLCFFHFAQSVYRKVQELGLSVQYSEEDSWVKQWIHRASSLAFVPPEDVVETFTSLCEQL